MIWLRFYNRCLPHPCHRWHCVLNRRLSVRGSPKLPPWKGVHQVHCSTVHDQKAPITPWRRDVRKPPSTAHAFQPARLTELSTESIEPYAVSEPGQTTCGSRIKGFLAVLLLTEIQMLLRSQDSCGGCQRTADWSIIYYPQQASLSVHSSGRAGLCGWGWSYWLQVSPTNHLQEQACVCCPLLQEPGNQSWLNSESDSQWDGKCNS